MPDAITRKIAALADTSGLPDYEGLPVVSTSIAVTNTGDGLSQSMAVEPILYPTGTKRYVVIECDVPSHQHDLLEGGQAYHVKQKFKGGVAVVVDADLVAEVIEAQRERIRKARDEATGTMELPLDGDPPAPTEPFPGDKPDDEVGTRRRARKATAKKAAAKPKGS